MTINFTNNVEQYTTAQKSTREKHFMDFTSKKQLENADVLGDAELEFAKSIKNTFSFALHENKRYMAVTLYKATAEKKYTFLVLDLQEKKVAEMDSIKNAKAAIMELAMAGRVAELENNEDSNDEDGEA